MMRPRRDRLRRDCSIEMYAPRDECPQRTDRVWFELATCFFGRIREVNRPSESEALRRLAQESIRSQKWADNGQIGEGEEVTHSNPRKRDNTDRNFYRLQCRLSTCSMFRIIKTYFATRRRPVAQYRYDRRFIIMVSIYNADMTRRTGKGK